MGELRDIPRLYTGIAEWLSCLLFLLPVRRRVSNAAFAGISAAMLLLQCTFLILTAGMPPGILWILCMVVAVALMFCFIEACGTFSHQAALYCCAGAFLTAEFTASLEWQLHAWLTAAGILSRGGGYLLLFLTYGAVGLLAVFLLWPQLKEEYFRRLSWQEAFAATLIVLISFVFSNLSFFLKTSPFSGQVLMDIFNIRTLVDLGGMAVLCAYQSRIGELLAEEEVSAIRQVLNSQYDQYRNYQESEEMLHMMQHDLKHQIDGLRAETDRERRAEWLDAMEEELDSWWIPQKTGSPVLDTILAAKLRKARNLKIRITCVADGSLLSMLHVVDICTIFGNALDNAMESVVQIPEEEKRLVHLSVSARKDFVFIQVSNTCETEIRQAEDNSLLTTKPDSRFHGYGMKSIRYAAEKYGGSVNYRLENGWFELRILLPREEKTGQK